MAFRRHNPQWLGVYRSDNSNYVRSGEPVLVGGSAGYNTLIGFNSTAMLDDINTSKVQPRIHLRMYVSNAGTFDYGVHKSTTNKASNGIPFYRWTGRSFNPSTGSKSYDITDFNVSVDGHTTLIQAMKNGGYHGPVLYGGSGGAYGEANSLYIEIEGTWNEPPTAPTLTYPSGGETLSGEVTFTADAATDPEADSLTYQFSLKDGEKTHYFSRDGLSLTVDLSDYAETSSAKVGVRAYDGQAYGPWDYSNVFTIRHNTPPSQPTLIKPTGGVVKDRSQTIEFSWNHNDSDPQSIFRFRWKQQGETVWNVFSATTPNEYTAVAPNTFPAGTIEWQVQTVDQGNLDSPWSQIAVFQSADQSNAPTITSPSEGEIISVENPTVTWSSSDQQQYEVEVLDGTVVHLSVSRTSGNKGVTIGTPLENITSYSIRVRIADSGGLWSDWASVNITTSFTPPTQAEIEVSANESTASIYLDIENPLPTGTQPEVSHNDLYRRKQGEGWIRIAKELPPNTGYMDYTPAGSVVYEYRVTTHGVNGTRMDSVPVIGSVDIKKTRLSLALNPTSFVELDRVGGRDFSYQPDSHVMQFAGRRNPVVQFGEMITNNGSLECLVNRDELDTLKTLALSGQTLIYRDPRERKQYVAATGLKIIDENSKLYRVSLPITEVDYKEEV